jgi:hypothetical protein
VFDFLRTLRVRRRSIGAASGSEHFFPSFSIKGSTRYHSRR